MQFPDNSAVYKKINNNNNTNCTHCNSKQCATKGRRSDRISRKGSATAQANINIIKSALSNVWAGINIHRDPGSGIRDKPGPGLDARIQDQLDRDPEFLRSVP